MAIDLGRTGYRTFCVHSFVQGRGRKLVTWFRKCCPYYEIKLHFLLFRPFCAQFLKFYNPIWHRSYFPEYFISSDGAVIANYGNYVLLLT